MASSRLKQNLASHSFRNKLASRDSKKDIASNTPGTNKDGPPASQVGEGFLAVDDASASPEGSRHEQYRQESRQLPPPETKIAIDRHTLKALKLETENLLPTSLHVLAETLSNSESVMSLHSFGEKRELSLLTNSMGSLMINGQREGEGQQGNIKEDELKTALRDLSKEVGSTVKTISTWEEFVEVLSRVLILPKTDMAEKATVNKRGNRRKTSKARETYLETIHKKINSNVSSKHIFKQISFYSPLSPRAMKTSSDQKEDELKGAGSPLGVEAEIEILRRKAEEKEKKVDEKVQALMLAKEEKERQKDVLPPPSEEERAMVKAALYGPGRGDEIIATAETDSVQRDSIKKLQPGQWLNDEVIHYFLQMLTRRDETLCNQDPSQKRCHFFKSFFITKLLDEGGYRYANVKRWSKKVPGKDVFNLNKIIFPINVSGVHWCCAIIFMQEQKIQFYDSMGGGGMGYLNALLSYLKDEHKAKKGSELDTSNWRLVTCERNTPQQENGFDCGVFTCMFADFVSRDAALTFTQEHVTECRERIALSILKGSALF